MATYLSGNSSPAAASLPALIEVKLRTISFHFSASAVRPPATIRPVAGHITQRSTSAYVWSATTCRAVSTGGAITHAITMPMPIDRVTRRPTRRPEPKERRLTSVPIRSAVPWAPRESSAGITGRSCRAFPRSVALKWKSRKKAASAERLKPQPSARTRARACLRSRSSTSMVSPAAVPSAKGRSSSSM